MRADDRAEINDAPALGAKPVDRLLHHENRPEHVDACVFAHCVVLPSCRCAAGDARCQFLPGIWTVMLTVVSDLNTRTSNGNAMFFVFQKTALDGS